MKDKAWTLGVLLVAVLLVVLLTSAQRSDMGRYQIADAAARADAAWKIDTTTGRTWWCSWSLDTCFAKEDAPVDTP